MPDRLPAIERLLSIVGLLNADVTEGTPIWEWTPEEVEALVRRLIDATEAAGIEYDMLMEDSAPAAEPARAGEDTTFRAGQIVRWRYRRRPESEWFTARLDDRQCTSGHDWHGVVVESGTYPDARPGDDMWLMEDCLTPVPAVTVEGGGGEPATDPTPVTPGGTT
jgi:hypothetical protein